MKELKCPKCGSVFSVDEGHDFRRAGAFVQLGMGALLHFESDGLGALQDGDFGR